MGEETTLEKLFKSMDKDGDGTVTKEVDDCSHICSRSFSYLFKIVLIFTPKASRAVLVQKYSVTWRKRSYICHLIDLCQSSPTLLAIITKCITKSLPITINIMILPGVPEDLQEFDSRPSDDNKIIFILIFQ